MATVDLLLPRPHKNQQHLLDNRKRFNALKCGRRWGKTELCQELILECFEKEEFVGYFSPTYKDLHEVWKTTLHNFHNVIASKNEQVKQVVFINGSKVDFWSMEDPNSGRGRKYHRAIMDECEKALKFQEAWEQAISPTLTDFGGDAYFLSTPKFGQTYFKELCKRKNIQPELWETFVFTTYDNPHINRNEIEVLRSILPPLVFQCEYLAEDVDGRTLSPFAHLFERVKHVSEKAVHVDNRRIILSIDFNMQPFACSFSHLWEDINGIHDHTFDEIDIPQGSIHKMAEEIMLRYSKQMHLIEITGDYMGNRGEISQRDNSSLYMQLLQLLKLPKSCLKLKPNPLHKNSKADLNFVLWLAKTPGKKVEYLIHPNCKNTIFDMENVQWDSIKEKIKKENRTDEAQHSDQMDTQRYKVEAYWKNIIKRYR